MILPFEEQMKKMKSPAVIVPLRDAKSTARMVVDKPDVSFTLLAGTHGGCGILHIKKCDVLDYGEDYRMWSAMMGGGVLARSAEEAAIKWCASKDHRWHLLHTDSSFPHCPDGGK